VRKLNGTEGAGEISQGWVHMTCLTTGVRLRSVDTLTVLPGYCMKPPCPWQQGLTRPIGHRVVSGTLRSLNSIAFREDLTYLFHDVHGTPVTSLGAEKPLHLVPNKQNLP